VRDIDTGGRIFPSIAREEPYGTPEPGEVDRGFISMRMAITLIGLVALAGCASAPKPERTTAQSICAAAFADPALDPVRDKIPFQDDPAAKASIGSLSDTRRPTAIERQALQQLDAANRRCWDAWDRVGSSPSINQARVDVSSALAELYQGQSTYGDFNRRRSAALTRMYAALREEEDRTRYGYGDYGYGGHGGAPFSIGIFGVFR
jgi:hypothetical protein